MIKAFDDIFRLNKMTLKSKRFFLSDLCFLIFFPTALQVNNAIHQSRAAVLKCSDASTWQNSTCLHGCIASILAWTSGNLSPNKTDCYFRLIVCNDHFKEICFLWSCFSLEIWLLNCDFKVEWGCNNFFCLKSSFRY